MTHEMTYEGNAVMFYRVIEGFLKEHPGAKIVITMDEYGDIQAHLK